MQRRTRARGPASGGASPSGTKISPNWFPAPPVPARACPAARTSASARRPKRRPRGWICSCATICFVREAEFEHHAARGGLVLHAVGVIDEVALRAAVGCGHLPQVFARRLGDVGVAVGEHVAGHVVGALLRQKQVADVAAHGVRVPFDDDLADIAAILVGEEHVQIHGQEGVDAAAALVRELGFASGEEHVAGQGDGAAGGIDRGGDVGLAQGAGKVGDDLRAHAHQVFDLPLLLRKLALLLGRSGFPWAASCACCASIWLCCVGHLALLRLELRLLLVELG